jgi:formiminoglutamate deiminase
VKWWCEWAWLGGPEAAGDVLLTADAGRWTAVDVGVTRPPDAEPLAGLVLPGLANTHSHAFHRGLRGRTQAGQGDFWTWRRDMYALADRLDPDSYRDLATAVYAEMTLAGFTAVGEFHYLHHDTGGRPYGDSNEMGRAPVEAAAAAGLRVALLDTCYLRGGFDSAELDPVQRRFSDGSADAWAERAASLADTVPAGDDVHVGAAIHSVRAVAPAELGVVAAWAKERGAPLHVHVSEQPAENEACRAATGRTPSLLLDDHGALGPSTTAVHATHLTDDDLSAIQASGTGVCLCPTTERDLADGIGPSAALAARSVPISLGTDSHAVIDGFEEARAVELDERLATGERGRHPPDALLAAATSGGAAALGWPEWGLVAGAPADAISVDMDSIRMAGFAPERAAAHVVFAASAADVLDVVVAGRPVVSEGRHLLVDDAATALRRILAELDDR